MNRKNIYINLMVKALLRTIAIILFMATPSMSIGQSNPDQPDTPTPEAARLYADGQAALASENFEQAALNFSQSCNLGYSAACVDAGRILLDHLPSTANDTKARGQFVRGCILRNGNACRGLAPLMQRGVGGPVDKDGALNIYKMLCEANAVDGCALHAILIANKLSAATDDSSRNAIYSLARTSYFKACDLGAADACVDAGAYAAEGRGGAKDGALAVKYSQQACEGGEIKGCANMGVFAREGFGMATDNGIAKSYFSKACDGGVAIACSNLGTLWMDEAATAKTKTTAFVLAVIAFEKACKGNDPMGCSNLATAYYKGDGIAKSYPSAMQFAQKACELDYANGCYTQAVMYYTGEGVTQDIFKFRIWATRACDKGHAQACTNIGMFYLHGKGGFVRDVQKAGQLLKQGCDGGYQRACSELANLEPSRE
ncbi:MAG: tetratricopeptide repeat protein [Parasphingorhabdus sp.]|uniref:tetratricopeptide repeat protein n=1 Tax=Parasphingorhabdus sp. TaxID=2709688 RepID=UPI0030011F1C